MGAQQSIASLLAARRDEVELAAFNRVCSIADPIEAADPEYADGLKLAVRSALDYALAAIEHGHENAPPTPSTLLAQARLAARNRVSLDTVLRRYFTGYTLFGDFLIREVERAGLQGAELTKLLQAQASLFDQLVAEVSVEYEQETKRRLRSPERRRVKHVQRLLAGELIDTAELAYEVDAWHVGVVAVGAGLEGAFRKLAEMLDRTLLLVRPAEDTFWAWLGGRRAIPRQEILERGAARCFSRASVALGEPCEGLTGWRLTHRQARAALSIAKNGPGSVIRYADVGLLIAILQDETFATTLRQRYLAPLTTVYDGGTTLRETLRAYLAAGRNVSSTAATLGVNRRTVTRRLNTLEEKLGPHSKASDAEIEAALRLWDWEESPCSESAQIESAHMSNRPTLVTPESEAD